MLTEQRCIADSICRGMPLFYSPSVYGFGTVQKQQKYKTH